MQHAFATPVSSPVRQVWSVSRRRLEHRAGAPRQQASMGVFDFNAANKAAVDTMQMWIDKKLLDPTNLEQMNAAWNYQAKYLRDLADAASVAGSKLPQLQQALNDASNVNKQLDQFATSSMTPVTAGMAEINL